MSRIVRDHYPVSKLPEDLREGFGPDQEVRVTVDTMQGIAVDSGAHDVASFRRPRQIDLSRFKSARRANYHSMDEIVRYVGSLRDEWIDRER